MSLNSPDAYLNINNANLRVYGNVHTNQVHLGNMTVRPSYGLSTVTDVSNTTPDTIQFTNTHTAFTTTGNVSVGKELTVTGNVEVGTANLFVDTLSGNIGIGTSEPSNLLHVYKANNDETSGILIEKASGEVPTCAALFFGVTAPTETNNRGIPKAAIFYERSLGNGRGDLKFCNDEIDDTNPVSTAASDTRMIIKNSGNVGIGTTSPTQKLDVNGVIKSNVPSWGLHQLSTASGDLQFSGRHITEQNCTVSLSTGSPARTRVTATVAGRYFVCFTAFTESNVSAGTDVQISLKKNGSTYSRNFHQQPRSNFSATGGLAVVVDLAVDDYLEVNSNQSLHFNSNGYFSGFLIG
jgi:hypothetical protein